MSIPNELKEAYVNGYRQFSWIKKINEYTESLRTYFEKGQKYFKGTRFYWQTPEQELILVGFGKEQVLVEDQASFNNVDAFLLKEHDLVYQNETISGAGAMLVGGFAFDDHSIEQNEWGEMDRGLFYLPTFLFSQKNEQRYLTINFSAESLAELEYKWHALNEQIEEIMQEQVKTNTTFQEIIAEEVAVSEWMKLVDQTVEYLKRSGPLEKVVLARRMRVKTNDSFQAEYILRNLQEQQMNTYFFVLESADQLFIGASPERLLKATDIAFSTASIAGSVSRGTTAAEDEELGNYLLNDMKNRQEHKIVVDRITREVEQMTGVSILPQAPKLLKNRDIQHLHLPIEGKRQKEYRFLKGVKQLHPTPALGGEPKELALEWLRQHEKLDRGLYGAPIGWVAIKEDIGEFAVGIRSAVFSGDTGYLYAGCGIVKDSQAEQEREETKIKFQPMLRGIGGKINDKSN